MTSYRFSDEGICPFSYMSYVLLLRITLSIRLSGPRTAHSADGNFTYQYYAIRLKVLIPPQQLLGIGTTGSLSWWGTCNPV
jgi:hypothetical protein